MLKVLWQISIQKICGMKGIDALFPENPQYGGDNGENIK
jgi:hypothetical protein